MEQAFNVSLRIRHPNADPAELTRHLRLQPQHCWRAGDERPAQLEGASAAHYRETYWFAQMPQPALEAETAAESLPMPSLEFTLALAMHVFDRCPAFWRRFIAEGGSAEFLIEVFDSSGFSLELSQDTVAKMARLGLAISVSVNTELQAVA